MHASTACCQAGWNHSYPPAPLLLDDGNKTIWEVFAGEVGTRTAQHRRSEQAVDRRSQNCRKKERFEIMASQPYLGGIFMFAGNFAPRGYQLCQGQVLSISQNAALFSILGTTYGGNGTTNFQLPNLQGRAAIGAGNGAGLPPVTLGETAGSPTVTLLTTNLPPHSHPLMANNQPAVAGDPTGAVLANSGNAQSGGLPVYLAATAPNATMNAQSIGLAGGGQPVSVRNPSLGINYIIATQGIFPSRN
jgi:microcystin-dependent protein